SLADSYRPSISLDGRYVAFLRGGAHGFDVWLHDRTEGTTQPVSRALDASDGNGCAFAPRVSTAPVVVAFESSAGNLLAGVADPAADSTLIDVFVAEDVPPVTTTTSTSTTTTTVEPTTSTTPSTLLPGTTSSTSSSTSTSTTTTTLRPDSGCSGPSLVRLGC